MGPHKPMPADTLMGYMWERPARSSGVEFVHQDFAETMAMAGDGETAYRGSLRTCTASRSSGAETSAPTGFWEALAQAVGRGGRVAVSFDGNSDGSVRASDRPRNPGGPLRT